MSKPSDAYTTYLNDHDAAAGAALDLMAHLCEDNEGTAADAFLKTLHQEVTEERQILERCMKSLGVERALTKRVLADVAEKLGRVQLALHGEQGELELLMGLDTLTSGVAGKLGLWQALEELAAVDERLGGVDFAALQSRSQVQLEGLERQRRTIAVAALEA